MAFRTGFLTALGILCFLASTLFAACRLRAQANGEYPPALDKAEMLLGFVQLIAITTWIQTDAQRRGQTPCFDFGLLLFWTNWFGLFGYCVWSRGWRGVLPISVFLLIFVIGPAIAGGMLYVGTLTWTEFQVTGERLQA